MHAGRAKCMQEEQMHAVKPNAGTQEHQMHAQSLQMYAKEGSTGADL